MFLKASSTLVESKAEVSMNDKLFFSGTEGPMQTGGQPHHFLELWDLKGFPAQGLRLLICKMEVMAIPPAKDGSES